MQLELELQPRRRHRLFLASSPEAAWQDAIAPGLKETAAEAWTSERPAVIVVPTRGQIQALKGGLLHAGLSSLGLQFVTPPYLRALLAAQNETLPAPRENLRLLLALAAEQLLADEKLPEPQRLAAISVRRTPDHLLSLLEQLSGAGADFEEIDLPAFRPVVRKFRAHLKTTGFEIFPESDRRALTHARQTGPVLGPVLLTGFHGGHWPLWHLLSAAVQSSERATVILQHPREQAHDLDSAWAGTWEETLGEAELIGIDSDEGESRPPTIFLAGMDMREQVEAIVAAAHQFLAEENCARLGIVFPAAGSLPRLVAAALTRHGLPHYDALGQLAPGLFETPDFWSWIELQRTPRLNVLQRFLTALPDDQSFLQNPSRRKIGSLLERALADIAIDDLPLLVAAATSGDGNGERISAALENIVFLPDQSTFAEFLRITGKAFELLGWNERWRAIAQRTNSIAKVDATFSRTLFLQWLDEMAVSVRVTRDLLGQHPYSRIHLLTPAQAEDQSWSHLILCGLNEGSWPAGARGDFLPAGQIDALNQSVRKLNRAATQQGRQGEGHDVIREGSTLFLGADQQRQLGRAQFESLVGSVSHGLALTVSLVQESAPERLSNPGEFFGRAYHKVQKHPISQANMRALRDQTRRWLEAATTLAPSGPPSETPGILQTRTAYLRRRTLEPANEYDFALRTAPDEIKPLSVSDTEALLKSPALIWMERFLGVEGTEDATYVWNATIGKWTHAWLAAAFGQSEAFVTLPHADELASRISAAAERKRAEVRELCGRSGRTIPDWWDSGWENALCLAQTLGRIVGAIEGWKWAAAEWRLQAQAVDVGENRTLLLRGQADLLLAKTEALPSSLALPDLWIVDFKTGNKKSLSPSSRIKEPRPPRTLKSVLKGDALQLALYHLAARQLGAQRVGVSIFSPTITRAEPQLADEDFADCGPAFQELARMQATAIFGMKGSLRSAFSFTKNYPLATLAIEPEIIDERWELTHPDLALEEESW